MTTLAALAILAPVKATTYDMRVVYERPTVTVESYIKAHQAVNMVGNIDKEMWAEMLASEYEMVTRHSPSFAGTAVLTESSAGSEIKVEGTWDFAPFGTANKREHFQTDSDGKSTSTGNGAMLPGGQSFSNLARSFYQHFEVAVLTDNQALIERLKRLYARYHSPADPSVLTYPMNITRDDSGQITSAVLSNTDLGTEISHFKRTPGGWEIRSNGWGPGPLAIITLTEVTR